MKAVLQRCSSAGVRIEKEKENRIGHGLVVLLGITDDDSDEDINWLVKKIINLRIFDDKEGVMNLSLSDIEGEVLLVSQFTLHALTKKGNRPSYIKAAKPEVAVPLYEKFKDTLANVVKKMETGSFGAYMEVSLVNDGPVTIILDTKNKT